MIHCQTTSRLDPHKAGSSACSLPEFLSFRETVSTYHYRLNFKRPSHVIGIFFLRIVIHDDQTIVWQY